MAKTFVRDKNGNVLYSFETDSRGRTHYYAEQIGGTEMGWFDKDYTCLTIGFDQGQRVGPNPGKLVRECYKRKLHGDWSQVI